MQKGFRIFSIVLAIVLALYFSWSAAGRKAPAIDVRLQIDSMQVIGADSGRGNLVGINPHMIPQDYATAAHFQAKLDGYLQVAQLEGWLKPNTVVLFPEYIGTWLVLAGEKTSALSAPSTEQAMRRYVSSNIFFFLRNWFMAPDQAEDKVTHSVFASKTERMASVYQDVFSKLAAKYKVTVVAGSILLQNPVVRKRKIRIGNGPLYNVTAVFNPDGSLQEPLVRKAFPTADEQPFLARGSAGDIPVFTLPVGKTGVAICADAWFPETYRNMADRQARIILVPSYTQQDNAMNQPWSGYSGYPAPSDVDSTDIGRISLREAWVKYTLPSRLKSSGAPYGLLTTLKGKLWDLGTDGEYLVVTPDSVSLGPKGPGASLVNLYLR